MLFTADGQLHMQMRNLTCYGAITGGRFLVNIKQTYINTDGVGCCVFRFKLPEKAFVSKLEVKTPEKEITTEYIQVEQALEAMEDSSSSPITLDENGYFSAVLGVIKPHQEVEISFTYIQEVSPYRSIRITLPLHTRERLDNDFHMAARICWLSAKGEVSASGSHDASIDGNNILLRDICNLDKDITLDLKCDDCSLFNLYKGETHTLLLGNLPFEPQRRQRAYDYLFIVDTSKAVREHWENIKNAILSCICAMEEPESFNIIAFGLSPKLLSIGSLRATESSKSSAKIWLDDIRPSGGGDIGEAINFAQQMVTRKTDVFLLTNSQFINKNTILENTKHLNRASFNVITGAKNAQIAGELAQAGGGYADIAHDPRDLADNLCKAVSRCLIGGMTNFTLSTDKKLVWHMEKEGMIYPWDNLKIIAQPNAPTVEIGEAQGYIDNELLKTSFVISPQTKGADIMCGLGLIPEADEAMQVRISNKHNIPSKYTTLSMTVNSLEN
ncbi:MAG: VIT domain-containing protein, partial [Eubacteriales bacterium]|nr:VIT domain-containing protein [Eubacteriales bacterium]